MVTCYVRHAPLHSPPAPHSPLAVALPDTGTMCSFLPVGGRTFHLLWAKVSILPPSHPPLPKPGPHSNANSGFRCSTSHSLHLLLRWTWKDAVAPRLVLTARQQHCCCYFFTRFESFNLTVWNQNCLPNVFCSHLFKLTEWLSWFMPDCWFVVYRGGKREIWRSGVSVLLRIQERKKKMWCGCFTGRLRLSAQTHPIYAGDCTQSWAETD